MTNFDALFTFFSKIAALLADDFNAAGISSERTDIIRVRRRIAARLVIVNEIADQAERAYKDAHGLHTEEGAKLNDLASKATLLGIKADDALGCDFDKFYNEAVFARSEELAAS